MPKIRFVVERTTGAVQEYTAELNVRDAGLAQAIKFDQHMYLNPGDILIIPGFQVQIPVEPMAEGEEEKYRRIECSSHSDTKPK